MTRSEEELREEPASEVPRYWMPTIVGIALFVAGATMWATSRHS